MNQIAQRKWFAYIDGEVKGPYDRIDLENEISAWKNPLVWGRGQNEWVPPDKWLQLLHQTEELIRTSHIGVGQMWRVKVGDQETKPLTHPQMMSYLKDLPSLTGVMLWTEGYDEWKDIYQIHKIMDDLGVSRRVHARVPIMGTLTAKGQDTEFTARLQSISEGGLGVTEIPKVKIGSIYDAVLKSPNLLSPLNFTIEVVYINSSGYAGIKLLNLTSEVRTTIVEYVNKFKSPEPKG